MAGGQERVLRRRIQSVQATRKITHAMELIAATQIHRAQARLGASRPYIRGMAAMLADAARDAGGAAGRLIRPPESPRNIVILSIVGDRGLCGAYNSSVLRATDRLIEASQAAGQGVRLVTVGKKAVGYFGYRGQPVYRSFTGMSDRPSHADARLVAPYVIDPFLEGEADLVQVVSTRFVSSGIQQVEIHDVLPVPIPSLNDEDAGKREASGYVEFEPISQVLLDVLAPRYAEALVFGALLEASASEHTARQRAMAAATENADDLTKTLSRIMNRARQDAITTEIMEIVGGAEALQKSRDAGPDELDIGTVEMRGADAR